MPQKIKRDRKNAERKDGEKEPQLPIKETAGNDQQQSGEKENKAKRAAKRPIGQRAHASGIPAPRAMTRTPSTQEELVGLGCELINVPSGGLPESASEPRAAPSHRS